MASNHLTTKPLARAKGGNAVHTAAYILRMRLEDERTGRVWDYSRKADDVLFAGRFIPRGAAGWMMDDGQLWNGAERADKKSNARTGRVVQMGLHNELTLEQNRLLLTDFVRENFTRKGIAAAVAIHKAGEGDERNIHAHILLTTRYAGQDGLGEKDRDSNRVDVLKEWRADWEKRSNKAFQRYGIDARMSMQTLDAQGIERTPETHLGKTAAALERKGIETSRGDDLREARAENRVREMVREMEPVAVVSAIERMRLAEDTERLATARREVGRASAMPVGARELVQAVRRLFQTMGVALGNIMAVDRGDVRGQGLQMRAELVKAEEVRLGLAPRANVVEMPAADVKKAARDLEQEKPLEPARSSETETKRETLLERLEREEREQGRELRVKLAAEPDRKLEMLKRPRRRRRKPGEPDEPD